MIITMVLGLIAGFGLGMVLGITYPTEYSFYITMALLACLDAVLGGMKAQMQNKFDMVVFLSGFFGNALLAAFLTYLGDRLGVPLYYAAIFVFGGRLFNNFAAIRRIYIDKYIRKKT